MPPLFETGEKIIDSRQAGVRSLAKLRKKTSHQQVVFDRHTWPQLAAFRHQADVPLDAFPCRECGNVFSVEQQAAFSGEKHARDSIERGGLACAVGSDHAGDASSGDGEAYAPENLCGPVADLEVAGDKK